MYNKKHRKNAWKLLLIVYRYLLKIEGQKLFKMGAETQLSVPVLIRVNIRANFCKARF